MDWVSMVQQVFSTSLAYLALVANKANLTHMRVVDPSQHVAFADTLSMSRYLTVHIKTQPCSLLHSASCHVHTGPLVY